MQIVQLVLPKAFPLPIEEVVDRARIRASLPPRPTVHRSSARSTGQENLT